MATINNKKNLYKKKGFGKRNGIICNAIGNWCAIPSYDA
jgi:hypothetical protein